jgi:hypothetical protein
LRAIESWRVKLRVFKVWREYFKTDGSSGGFMKFLKKKKKKNLESLLELLAFYTKHP